jgi:hypothetical protein
MLGIHFYFQIITHMQKLSLLDSCLFPLLQIPCIDNNQGNNSYIVLSSMWIILILVLPTHVQTNILLNKKTMLCVHTRIYTLHIHTCVRKCLHHLLLLHTTIIKMSLSCLGKLFWFHVLIFQCMVLLIFYTILLIDLFSIFTPYAPYLHIASFSPPCTPSPFLLWSLRFIIPFSTLIIS